MVRPSAERVGAMTLSPSKKVSWRSSVPGKACHQMFWVPPWPET